MIQNETLRKRLDAICERQVPILDQPGDFLCLLDRIVRKAAEFWDYEGADPHDFCIQDNQISDGVIIFGGSNRLIWRVDGFRADRTYCTMKFLVHHDVLQTK